MPPAVRSRRSALLGAIAGLIGIGCCVYPVALVLLGLSSAAAAVDLANALFDAWGWAFKLAGAAFALAACGSSAGGPERVRSVLDRPC